MKRTISSLLIKVCILLGAFFLGMAARTRAQSPTPNQQPSDTTHHHYGMHRGWGNRQGGDSLAKRDGFRKGQSDHNGFRDGRGEEGRDEEGRAWGHGREGRGREGRNWDHGQDGWASHGRRQHGFEHERIHYTPEQRQQQRAIKKEFEEKSEALFAQDNITLKQYKAGLIVLQKDKKAKLAALITPQQKNEMAERRMHMTENDQVMAVARLERLRLHLNLTDDQVAKLKAGQQNLRSQAKAIHGNDNLLPQEKREQMKALLAKRNDTYKAVLTPEQFSQFEKMHHRPGGRRFGGGPNGPGEPGSAI